MSQDAEKSQRCEVGIKPALQDLKASTLPRGCKSQLLQRHGRVFACRSFDLGSTLGWGRLKYFHRIHYIPDLERQFESITILYVL